MDFAHIAPTDYLNKIDLKNYKTHLLLAHLVERDSQYTKFYADIATKRDEFTGTSKVKTYILDNSAYELYRAGLPMFDGDKMIKLGKHVKADYLVMPDYPNKPGYETISAAMYHADDFKKAKFGTFFVPQSQIGDLQDYIATFAWAASAPQVDYIGMSILGIPNAYGVDGNLTQRFVSRWRMFNELSKRGLLQLAKSNGKKIHCLGMTDGPNEVILLREWIKDGTIDTWDSSAAVWAGIEGVEFDDSPTGLEHGKVQTHVDFDLDFEESNVPLIKSNMKVIDDLVDRAHR